MAQVKVDRPANPRPVRMHAAGQDGVQPATPAAENKDAVSRFQLLTYCVRCIPTLAVIALLAALGVYGHRWDWKLPKFSTLAGDSAAEREKWCEEHGVSESQCVECHPSLLLQGHDYGWCEEHGVANCPLCHPDAAELKQMPVIAEVDRHRAARIAAAEPRSGNNPACKNYLRRIQFASTESVRKAGVDTAPAARRPMTESISVSGQITYDMTRFASLTARLPGSIWRVEKRVGDTVRCGDVLAIVDAADAGRAKTELIQALAQEQLQRNAVNRMKSVADIVPHGKVEEVEAEYVHAQARLLSAQQALVNLGLPVNIEELRGLSQEKLVRRLRFLGLPQPVVDSVDAAVTSSNLLPVTAPLDGVVVSRQAVAGEVIDTSRMLFQVADTCRMWLTLNVSLEDSGKLVLGQPVRFRPDGCHEEMSGNLVWISTTADQQTRMVNVRAELPNPHGQLRNETFGAGRIVLREESDAIALPNEAVHWEGCCNVVFVRDRDYSEDSDGLKVFHVRTVRLGIRNGDFTEVIAGVLPGECVATKGSDVLRGALLKSALGAGCGED